jgi:hypothetical protein
VLVNSTYVSPKAISVLGTGVDAFYEVRRLLGPMLSSEDCTGLFKRSTWVKDVSADPTVSAYEVGSFMIGCNLMSFPNQAKLLSGVATRGATVELELNFRNDQIANIKSLLVSAVVATDQLCTIDGATKDFLVGF